MIWDGSKLAGTVPASIDGNGHKPSSERTANKGDRRPKPTTARSRKPLAAVQTPVHGAAGLDAERVEFFIVKARNVDEVFHLVRAALGELGIRFRVRRATQTRWSLTIETRAGKETIELLEAALAHSEGGPWLEMEAAKESLGRNHRELEAQDDRSGTDGGSTGNVNGQHRRHARRHDMGGDAD